VAGAVGALLLAALAALPKLLTVRSQNRRTDAETLAISYGHIIDRLEKQVDAQAGEIKALRDQVTELMKLVGSRDQEVGTLQANLAEALAENTTLRAKVDQLQNDVKQLPRRASDT
jgi:regulator of replication initiation timing